MPARRGVGWHTKGTMRTLTDHIVSGDQAVQLQIEVTDQPGAGGANHKYSMILPEFLNNEPELRHFDISFQNGPIKEVGVNGVTNEALIAIVIDRLRSFQAGPYACDDNHIALVNLLNALDRLQIRTLERIKRGVEGTHEK